MLVLFEVHIARTADPSQLLSPEVARDAKARILTLEEARKVGFAGLPEPDTDKQVRYIAAVGRDAQFIRHVLETSAIVDKLRAHEVET